MAIMVTLVYFAWVRSKLGRSRETLELPDGVATVAALVAWLREKGEPYASALGEKRAIRVAVNQAYAKDHHPVADGDEVAIFPPVTGG